MKLQSKLALIPVALILLAVLPLAQQRASKKVQTFGELQKEVVRLHDAGQFGEALAKCKAVIVILQEKWSGQILDALPAAPEGFEVVPQKKKSRQEAGMMAAMSGAVGTVIERQYQKGTDKITVTVQADSPLIQMFSMMVANPAMMGEDAELITYEGEIKAVLKKERNGSYSLQLVIGSSLVECKGKISDEVMLGMFNQRAVNRLKATLSK
jgi:hypothetical protein